MKALLYLPFIPAVFFFGENSSAHSHPPLSEICDNALDDDADGLTDLNDPDCDCPVAEPLSLIPNPSFEEQDCCPSDRSQLDCASGWIQASEATTDYLHTCGWMGWPDLPPPLPFPDGEGCVGFRNGRTGGPNGFEGQPNWKEYAGACLLSPLKAGLSYRFEFNVGFTKPFNSPPTTLVFFGSTDCVNLPFGIGNEGFGCPTNGPGWTPLGSVPISGANQWKQTEINVTPTEDIYAIAIGPDCIPIISDVSLYYFFDNLVLASVEEFDFKITAEGHPCSKNITLNFPERDTLQYQWYLDGVALVGETGAQLTGVSEEGSYTVRVLGPNSCRIAKPFVYEIPVFNNWTNSVICKGDAYLFNQQNLSAAGVYWDTLKTANNCDSILRLTLEVSAEKTDTVFAKIFEGESYRIGSHFFSRPGEHEVTLTSFHGCDSLIHLVLDFYKIYIPNAFSPNGDGLNDVFNIFGGEDVKEVLNLQVFDRWGGLVFETFDFKVNEFQTGWDGKRKGKKALPGVYVYKATVVFEDGKERELSGALTLVK